VQSDSATALSSCILLHSIGAIPQNIRELQSVAKALSNVPINAFLFYGTPLLTLRLVVETRTIFSS